MIALLLGGTEPVLPDTNETSVGAVAVVVLAGVVGLVLIGLLVRLVVRTLRKKG